MKNACVKGVLLSVLSISVFYSGISYSRTLENDLTYPLMEEYCQSIGKLGAFTSRLVARGLEEDDIQDQAITYTEEHNIDWEGKLSLNIYAETVDRAISAGKDGDPIRIQTWAYKNCNKRILFNKK